MANEEFLKTYAEPAPHPAVLADIAAKRRVLARHCLGERGLYAYIKGDWCAGCGAEGYDASPRTEDINRCPELLDLASAYVDRSSIR